MTKVSDQHLEQLTLREWEDFDPLSEEVLLIDRIPVLLPSHQLPFYPAVDEGSLRWRILLFVLLLLLLDILNDKVKNVILQAHNLKSTTLFYFKRTLSPHLVDIVSILEFPIRHQLQNFPYLRDFAEQDGIVTKLQGYSEEEDERLGQNMASNYHLTG